MLGRSVLETSLLAISVPGRDTEGPLGTELEIPVLLLESVFEPVDVCTGATEVEMPAGEDEGTVLPSNEAVRDPLDPGISGPDDGYELEIRRVAATQNTTSIVVCPLLSNVVWGRRVRARSGVNAERENGS